jgi:hypothetical protein
MKRAFAVPLLAALLGLEAGEMPVNFDSDAKGASPAGWTFGRTGQGQPGSWIVEEGAPPESPRKVLVQRSDDATDYRFPIALAPRAPFTDGSIAVRCKPISGKVDQACGVILRANDENDYVIARANALEDNVRLYDVTKGSRKQIAGWNGKVTSGAWHRLSLEAKGDEFVVTFDGREVIRAKSRAHRGPGKAGLWTKADSLTAFGDIVIDAVK